MRKMVSVASIMAFALTCFQPTPTNFKPSMQEGVMADAKSPVPAKAQVTYPNGVILLERRNGTIKIFDTDGSVIAEGKITGRLADGTITFVRTDGTSGDIDRRGFIGLGVMETPGTLRPAPNIK